jgi:hypothetical protein
MIPRSEHDKVVAERNELERALRKVLDAVAKNDAQALYRELGAGQLRFDILRALNLL